MLILVGLYRGSIIILVTSLIWKIDQKCSISWVPQENLFRLGVVTNLLDKVINFSMSNSSLYLCMPELIIFGASHSFIYYD